MHICIKNWNNLKRSSPELFQDQLTYSRIKSVLTNYLLNQYQTSKDHLTVYPFISSIQTQGQLAIKSPKLNTSLMNQCTNSYL